MVINSVILIQLQLRQDLSTNQCASPFYPISFQPSPGQIQSSQRPGVCVWTDRGNGASVETVIDVSTLVMFFVFATVKWCQYNFLFPKVWHRTNIENFKFEILCLKSVTDEQV